MRMNIVLVLVLVLLCGSALAQPMPTSTPPSPATMGIQAPMPSYSTQAPPISESNQALFTTTQAYASAAAPPMAHSTITNAYMIVPPGTSAPNLFYIPYYPSTVASCYFGQWIPMWLDVKRYGPLYTYEWYPNGKLVRQYPANIPYPSWQKMWFYGDAPGWHTLQYYCNGWSNYIYVYVYGGTSPYTMTPSYPNTYPYSYSGSMPPTQPPSPPGNMPVYPTQFPTTPAYTTQLPAGSPTATPY